MTAAVARGRKTVSAHRENSVNRVGSPVSVLLTGEDTEGHFAVIETVETEGSDHPYRVHTHEDQAVYVLEGLVSYCVDGEWLRCPAGTCLLLPKGCEYAYSVESERARLLVVAVPAGIEGCYRELDDSDGAPHSAAPDFERLVTVAARYGVEIGIPEAGTRVGQGGSSMEQG